MFEVAGQRKKTIVLGSKLTKNVGHFEENKFYFGCCQFLSECCPKLIITFNFGQNAVKKGQLKSKNEQYCAVRLLNFKVAETFCRLSLPFTMEVLVG